MSGYKNKNRIICIQNVRISLAMITVITMKYKALIVSWWEKINQNPRRVLILHEKSGARRDLMESQNILYTRKIKKVTEYLTKKNRTKNEFVGITDGH